MKTIYSKFLNEGGMAKYFLFAAIALLLVSLINPWFVLVDLKFVLCAYPLFWLLWVVMYAVKVAPFFKLTMKFAWAIAAIAILFTLLDGALLNSWSTSRQYVIMQDLTCLAFVPIVFPSGMIPELLGNALELFPFTGDGFIHKLEISHGLGLFVFLTWMKYAAASLFETWAIISIVAKIRKSKRFKKLQH